MILKRVNFTAFYCKGKEIMETTVSSFADSKNVSVEVPVNHQNQSHSLESSSHVNIPLITYTGKPKQLFQLFFDGFILFLEDFYFSRFFFKNSLLISIKIL